ncbi:type II and III secretion system protein family protein [Azospirillum sp. sgz302134]
MTRRILSCLVLLALGWTATGAAQAATQKLVPQSPPAQGRPTAPTAISAQGPGVLQIEQDKGEMLRLPQPASSVFIANPDVADLQVMSPTLVYLFGKKSGETSLIAVNDKEQVLLNRKVVITQNLSGLERALRQRLPNRAISVSSAEGAVVLSGEVASQTEAEDARAIARRFIDPDKGEVVNRLSITGATQVMLRVRVSEVSREVREEFGINWENMLKVGGFRFLLGSGLTDITFNNGTLIRPAEKMTLYGGASGKNYDVNGLIDALARDGLVTILAEPNLVALSGETASFLAGGEFPIPVPGDNGRTGIEYKQFGVSLSFTPTLVGTDRISMRVRPEVSQLTDVGGLTVSAGSNIGFRVPGLTTRRAETTIELGSGQSFAIAGLLQNNIDEAIDKFPFLGDVPVLGTLFRSTSFKRNETELVIIVTPYLVRPAANPGQIAAPTDTISPTTLADRLLRGRLTSAGPGARPPARLSLTGPAGFAVE